MFQLLKKIVLFITIQSREICVKSEDVNKMIKVDRRIKKSQEAIKKAFVEEIIERKFDHVTIQDISDRADVSRGTFYLHYVDKYDLLEKVINEHINELRERCEVCTELEQHEANLPWFIYLQQKKEFFGTMLASKEAIPYFRSEFELFLIEEFRDEVNIKSGKNKGKNAEIILHFTVNAFIGIIEWWFKNDMLYSPEEMASQVGFLLDRNL